MSDKNKLKSKWDKIKKLGKKSYIIKNVMLKRYIPMLIFIIIINNLFFKSYSYNLKAYIIEVIIKVIVVCILSTIVGSKSWEINKNIFSRKYTKFPEFKKKYIFTNGLSGIGGTIAIACFEYFYDVQYIIINTAMYLILGLIIGYFMWEINKFTFVDYLKIDDKKIK